MGEELNSLDLVEQLYKDAKDMDFPTWLEEHGGGHVYIPMYKSTYRDEDIMKDFNDGMKRLEIRKKYDLSESRVNEIIKEAREPKLL